MKDDVINKYIQLQQVMKTCRHDALEGRQEDDGEHQTYRQGVRFASPPACNLFRPSALLAELE